MDRSSRICLLLVFWFIIVSLQILPTIGEEKEKEKPPIVKMVADTIALLKQTHQNSWDKIKAVVKEMQSQLSPPNLDFRGKDEANREDIGEKVKEAAEKSFETAKENVEESAKSAAKVVGDAVDKTAQKVKQTVSDQDESKAEL